MVTQTDRWIFPLTTIVSIGVCILALQNSTTAFGSKKVCEVLVILSFLLGAVVLALQMKTLMPLKDNVDVLLVYVAVALTAGALLTHSVKALM